MTASREWEVEWHASLTSTMDRAAELAGRGCPSGTVVVADFQHEGRGTRGRVWTAPPRSCLMFTLVARPKIDPPSLSALPQRVAESIALALNEEFGLASALKDPNDVMVAGRKICGVLCTSKVVAEQVEWVLCGVGLNTAMVEHELPAAATSLACERIAAPANECILPLLLRRLEWLRDA